MNQEKNVQSPYLFLIYVQDRLKIQLKFIMESYYVFFFLFEDKLDCCLFLIARTELILIIFSLIAALKYIYMKCCIEWIIQLKRVNYYIVTWKTKNHARISPSILIKRWDEMYFIIYFLLHRKIVEAFRKIYSFSINDKGDIDW